MNRRRQFSLQKTVITGMLTAMFIPFFLLTDIYPFFRFGMFAEPVTKEIQLEQFVVLYVSQNKTVHFLDPAEVGLSSLTYLMRNYYYRQQSDTFLQNIHQIYSAKATIVEWQLLRITGSSQGAAKTDTTTVARFSPSAAL